MASIIECIRGEFERYKALGEAAIAQLSDAQLCQTGSANGNSIAVIVWHVSGNFRSRFTDFLTTDGEKPDRHRDEEFVHRMVSSAELRAKWDEGWRVVLSTLAELRDEDLDRTITIRAHPSLVKEALLRSLGHTSYHVGQIVFLAKALREGNWTYLSIPPGQSETYNQNPHNETVAGHIAAIRPA